MEPDYLKWSRQHSEAVKNVLFGPPHMEALWCAEERVEDFVYFHSRQAARYALEAAKEE
jgi:hypothetical protein